MLCPCRFPFFSLFSVVKSTSTVHAFTPHRIDVGKKVGKSSAVIGPFVSEAISASGNNDDMPFVFLFGL